MRFRIPHLFSSTLFGIAFLLSISVTLAEGKTNTKEEDSNPLFSNKEGQEASPRVVFTVNGGYRCQEYPKISESIPVAKARLESFSQMSFIASHINPDSIRVLVNARPTTITTKEIGEHTYAVTATLPEPYITKEGEVHMLVTGYYAEYCPLRYVHKVYITGNADQGGGSSFSQNGGEEEPSIETNPSDTDPNENNKEEDEGDTGESSTSPETTLITPNPSPIDQREGHWAEKTLYDFVSQGLLTEKEARSPNAPLIRARATEIALEAFGLSLSSAVVTSFPDVSSGLWYSVFLAAAKEQGVIQGFGDGLFRPLQHITRAEALALAVRAAGYDDTSFELKNMPFGDVEDYSWYAPLISWAADRGVVEGPGDGDFHPNDPATRAEYITMIVRIQALEE